MKYSDKINDLLDDVPINACSDLNHVVHILHDRDQKDVAKMLDQTRKDLLLYCNKEDMLDDTDLADSWFGLNGYENFLKMSPEEQEVNINLAYNMYNQRLDNNDNGFINSRLNYRFVHTGQKRTINWVPVNNQKTKKIEYTLEDKIKYYKKRLSGKYDGKKLTDGQVNYASKFLEKNGIRL